MANTKAPWHRGTYQVRAKTVTDAAYRSPSTRCWRCHLTLDQIQAKFPRRRVHWTAGHLNDSQIDGDLAPECSPCNYGHGATRGNRLRNLRRNTLNTSRQW